MSRFPLILFCVAGFITLAAAIEYQCFVNRLYFADSQQQRSSDHQEKKIQNPKERTLVNPPAPIPVNKKMGAADDEQNSSAKPEYDRRQTEAQEGTLTATWWGVGVSFVGFLAVIATLFYTARQTKELALTNRLMQDTLDAERRPWLSIEIEIDPREEREEFVPLVCDAPDIPIWLRATITNHGGSPAENVNVRFMLVVEGSVDYSHSLSERFGETKMTDRWNTTVFPSKTATRLGYVPLRRSALEDEIAKSPKKGIQIGVFGLVDYTSRWTEGVRQTCCAYSVEWEYADVVVRHNRIRSAGWEGEKVRIVLERSTAT